MIVEDIRPPPSELEKGEALFGEALEQYEQGEYDKAALTFALSAACGHFEAGLHLAKLQTTGRLDGPRADDVGAAVSCSLDALIVTTPVTQEWGARSSGSRASEATAVTPPDANETEVASETKDAAATGAKQEPELASKKAVEAGEEGVAEADSGDGELS